MWLYTAVVSVGSSPLGPSFIPSVITSGILSFVSSSVISPSLVSGYATDVIDFLNAKSKYSFLAVTTILFSL